MTSSKTEARSKLNQALESVEDEIEKEQAQPKENSESEEKEEDADKLPFKAKVKKEKEGSPAVKEQKFKPPKQPQQSYVMKLFDRSVNLAKFTEETPLYPLARSWMQNAPRQFTSKDKADPEILTAEEGDVVEIPRVRIRKGGKPLVARKDTKINKADFDKTIDSEVWTKEKLFEFHRSRWADERQKQIESYRNFEEKHFAANLELLDSLFKGNEE